MKTIKTYSLYIILMALVLTLQTNASNAQWNEAYVDDIPFSTEEIFLDLMAERAAGSFDFDEETYVDDIPFNTACVAAQCVYQQALRQNFDFEEESYRNDIPFDTQRIVAESRYQSALLEEFDFEEEPFIHDIPTELLYRKTGELICPQFADAR